MILTFKNRSQNLWGLFVGAVLATGQIAVAQEGVKPTKKVVCTAGYYRVDLGGGWGLAGDSNGVLDPELVWNEDQQAFTGNASYRFQRDQSSDDSNSPYGIRGDFTYSEGNGLSAIFNVSKFVTSRGRERATTLANFVASSTDDKPRISSVGIFGPELNELRLSNPAKNLLEWVKDGKLKQDDLVSVTINFCSLW